MKNLINKVIFSAFLFVFLAAPLAGCQNNSTASSSACAALSDTNQLVPTPLTDALAFPYASDYATKDFAAPTSGLAYGKAVLVTNTDGDTASFRTLASTYVKVRFLGINTPESTAKVEPWGVKASHFTAGILSSAKNICLVNDIDVYSQYDSSGGRNLGFVWYQLSDTASWRLLNLEIVEECYSKDLLFTDSTNLKYLDSFTKAGAADAACGYRVYGTQDPDYDYTSTVVEATIYEVWHDYASLGIDKDAGSSGKELHLKALVVGLLGDNLVLRDIVRDLAQADADPYMCIYAYAGYNSSLASKVAIGDVVYFYCRATTYAGNYQLSDLKTSSYGNYKFQVLASVGDANYSTYVSGDNGINPVVASGVTSKDVLGTYSGFYTQIDVTIRNIQAGDYDDNGNFIPSGEETYYNVGTSGTTVYAYVKDTTIACNLRIDSTCFPLLTYKNFAVGTSYRVKAYLSAYYTSYQLQVFSNLKGYDYVTAL
jgi:endonuclease YncB( thermonuclease family)